MIKKVFKGVIFILLFFGIGGIAILSNLDPNSSYDKKHPFTSSKTVTIILIDGLSKEIFEKEVKNGNLPHLKSLIKKSNYVKNGISSFPTMTGFGFYPFLTGMDAVESGIYGLRWFDRKRDEGNLRNYVGRTNVQMNRDVTEKYQSIFEYYSKYYTGSINSYMDRGANHSLKTGWAHTTAKYSKQSIFSFLNAVPIFGNDMAKDHFQHESLVTDLALSQLRRNPKVQWITYPSLDAHNHIHGTDSTYFQLLRHVDHEIGRIFKDIEFLNQKDRMIAVVSDHGISDVKVNLDMQKMLKDKLNLDFERGESTHLDTENLSTPLTDFINKDGYFVINGNLSGYLYMTDPNEVNDKKWRKKQFGKNLENYSVDQRKINLPLFISQQKGIDIVAFAHDNNTISLYKNGNKASVTKSRNGEFVYHYEKIDPLGLEELIEKEKLYTQDDLLVLTKDHEYPFVLPRLFNLISGSDSPDIVMTTVPGYDLADDYELFVGDYKGGHGGIRKELINVPYILYTPGEQPKITEVARSEDIGATIIQYLGMKNDYKLTGKPIN